MRRFNINTNGNLQTMKMDFIRVLDSINDVKRHGSRSINIVRIKTTKHAIVDSIKNM